MGKDKVEVYRRLDSENREALTVRQSLNACEIADETHHASRMHITIVNELMHGEINFLSSTVAVMHFLNQ